MKQLAARSEIEPLATKFFINSGAVKQAKEHWLMYRYLPDLSTTDSTSSNETPGAAISTEWLKL